MIIDRLSGPGPKRILALDGGGIRGALTIGYLIRIEEILQARHRDPDLRLRDYFDLIGGASTGSIIAAGLAVGMSAREVAEHYRELGPRVFGTKRRITGRLQSLFDGGKLVEVLAEQLGDRTLGDDSITTGLCIITKRADTRSTWPLLNHPSGKFYEANRDIPLTTAIRASTAAPFFFAPEGIDVGAGGGLGAFVDGAVSMASNPSLLLFLIATLQGFPFHWTTGRDDLLIVSIGTGKWSKGSPAETVLNHRFWNWAVEVPTMLMEDASNQADLLLRVLGWTPIPVEIDLEMGDLTDDIRGREPLLSYLRYDAPLDEDGLAEIDHRALTDRLDSLRMVAAGDNVGDLLELGLAFAGQDIAAEHLPPAFDLPG